MAIDDQLEQALAFGQVRSARTHRQLRAMEDETLEVIIEVEDPDSEIVELAASELHRRSGRHYRRMLSPSVRQFFNQPGESPATVHMLIGDAVVLAKFTAEDRSRADGEWLMETAFGNYMMLAAVREMTRS